MKNIEILASDINTLPFLVEIQDQPELWLFDTGRQDNIVVQQHTQNITLVNGIIEGEFTHDKFNDSQLYAKTALYDKFPKITSILHKVFPHGLSRIMIVKLLPGKEVLPHIDHGAYYRARNRFHLVLQGEYEYEVGDEKIVAKPGMLFRFNNQLMHRAVNLTAGDRISIIFDVERSVP